MYDAIEACGLGHANMGVVGRLDRDTSGPPPRVQERGVLDDSGRFRQTNTHASIKTGKLRGKSKSALLQKNQKK